MNRFRVISLLLIFVVVTAACGDPEEPNPDGGDADADADADSDGDLDEESDADGDDDGDADADSEPAFEFDRDRMFDDVAWLAAAERGGRAPGTEENEAALDYVEDVFEELGLHPLGDDDTFRDHFSFDQWWVGGEPEVALDGDDLSAGDEYFVIPYSGSGATTAEVVFAGFGMTVPPFNPEDYPDCPLDPETGYDDYQGLDVTDRVALVLRHGPADDEAIHEGCPGNEVCLEEPCLWTFGYKAANAALHGATAVIIVQDFHHVEDIPEGATLTAGYHDPEFPAVFVSRSISEAAIPELRAWAEEIDGAIAPSGHPTGVEVTIDVETSMETIETANLVGMIEGTDPEIGDEVVLIGAHVDHLGTDPVTGEIYYGADDNASGSAVMMELARAAASLDAPARSVVFASWNAEELGLIGSCDFARDPSEIRDNSVAVFSVDMVGAGDASGVDIYGGTDPMNRWIVDLMLASSRARGWRYSVGSLDPTDASDHACFALLAIPAVLVMTRGVHEFYHTPADTIDTIEPEDLEVAAMMLWSALEPLARGTEGDFLGDKRAPAATPPPFWLAPRVPGPLAPRPGQVPRW